MKKNKLIKLGETKNPNKKAQREKEKMNRVMISMKTGTISMESKKRKEICRKTGKKMIREAMGYC